MKKQKLRNMIKKIANKKLTGIKLIHTMIWFIFVIAIMYVCYAGVFNNLKEPVPYGLIARIVKFKVKENNKNFMRPKITENSNN